MQQASWLVVTRTRDRKVHARLAELAGRPIEEMSKLITGLPIEAFSDERKEHNIGEIHPWATGGPGTSLTPRLILQRIGNGAREVLGETVWIDRVIREIDSNKSQRYVITDVRYFNEIAAVADCADYDNVIIRLNRADRKDRHDFVPTSFLGARCGYGLNYSHPNENVTATLFCGLPRESHPSHWTGESHPSETQLPDENSLDSRPDTIHRGSLYDYVIEAASGDDAAQQVLVYLRSL